MVTKIKRVSVNVLTLLRKNLHLNVWSAPTKGKELELFRVVKAMTALTDTGFNELKSGGGGA